MLACAVGASVMLFDAVLCNVIPALALQASYRFSSAFFGLASFVADSQPVCDCSICSFGIAEIDEEVSCSLAYIPVRDCFRPTGRSDGGRVAFDVVGFTNFCYV